MKIKELIDENFIGQASPVGSTKKKIMSSTKRSKILKQEIDAQSNPKRKAK